MVLYVHPLICSSKQPYRAAAVIHACFADVETELEGEKYLLQLVHTTGHSPPHPSAGQKALESHLIPVGPMRYHQVYLDLTSHQTGGTWKAGTGSSTSSLAQGLAQTRAH